MDTRIRDAERSDDPERIAVETQCRIGKHEFTFWQEIGRGPLAGFDPDQHRRDGRHGPGMHVVEQRVCFWCFKHEHRRTFPGAWGTPERNYERIENAKPYRFEPYPS